MISVVAYSQNGIIGNDLLIPWKLPMDMKWFQLVTKTKTNNEKTNNFLLMGNNTYKSFCGRMLKDRVHCILSNKERFTEFDEIDLNKPIYLNSLDQYLQLRTKYNFENEYCIGGSVIYNLLDNSQLWEGTISTKILKDYNGNIGYSPYGELLRQGEEYIDNEIPFVHQLYINPKIAITRKDMILDKFSQFESQFEEMQKIHKKG